MAYFLYILFMIFFVLVYPIIQRILKSERWKRIIFYIYIPCTLIYITVVIVIVFSTRQKDIKLQSLVKQELLIKDLKVDVCYVFKLKSDVTEKGGRSMGLGIDAGFVNTSSKTDDILRMYTDYEFDLNYPNSKTAELSLEFMPIDQSQILNKPIRILEKYDLLVLPYETILKDFIKLDVEPRLRVDLQIVINGKRVNKYEEIIDIPVDTKVLNLRPKKGLFKNIEKRYLE